MRKTSFSLSFLMILAVSILFSCNRDEVQAENSLEGEWNVVQINSVYAEFFDNGYAPFETVVDSGQLGTFAFSGATVDYSFTRNDTLYEGSGMWDLQLEKENSGFTRVNKFTLTIEQEFLFDVTFEDATKNAEKNAKSVRFLEEPATTGIGVLVYMSLEKK